MSGSTFLARVTLVGGLVAAINTSAVAMILSSLRPGARIHIFAGFDAVGVEHPSSLPGAVLIGLSVGITCVCIGRARGPVRRLLRSVSD